MRHHGKERLTCEHRSSKHLQDFSWLAPRFGSGRRLDIAVLERVGNFISVAAEAVLPAVAAQLESRKGKIIMRPSIKRSLTGLLITGALAFSAVGAYGYGNGPDAFIGIVG